MDNDDPVFVPEDQKLLTTASLGLKDDERGVVESLENHADYGGRRLSTNVSVLGALGRGEA